MILRTPIWELEANPEHEYGSPPLLTNAASRLSGERDAVRILLNEGRDLPDQRTRYGLARLVARALGVVRVGEAAYADGDWVVVRAALSLADELGEAPWATGLLERTASTQPSELTGLLDYVDLTAPRLDLVVGAVEAGRSPVEPLANLMLGARAKQIDRGILLRILGLMRDAAAPGPALGVLDQWTDAHERDVSEEVRALGADLGLEAVRGPAQTMTEHYLERLIERRVVSGDALIAILGARLRNRTGRSDHLDTALVAAGLAEAPERLLAFALSLIHEGPKTSSLYGSSDLHLLSRLSGAVGADRVWRDISELTERELRWALHHMRWSGNQPEELVRAFLLSTRLEPLRDEAAVCFSNSLGIVTGPMHFALGREVERARSWASALSGTPAEGWAEALADSKERERQFMAEREAEEDARLGR